MRSHLSVGVRHSVSHVDFIRGKSELVLERQLVVRSAFGRVQLVYLIRVWWVVVRDVLTTFLVPATFSFVEVSIALCRPKGWFHALKSSLNKIEVQRNSGSNLRYQINYCLWWSLLCWWSPALQTQLSFSFWSRTTAGFGSRSSRSWWKHHRRSCSSCGSSRHLHTQSLRRK